MTNLEKYVFNPDCSKTCFNLANEYYDNGYYSEAVSFYCKSAELEEYDRLLVYSSLIRIFQCYFNIPDRAGMCKVSLQHAVTYEPTRPEAFLCFSHYWERQNDLALVYTMAVLGKANAHNTTVPLPIDVGYSFDKLLFQEAIGHWCVGNQDNGKKNLQILKDKGSLLEEELIPYVKQNIKNYANAGPGLFRYQNKWKSLLRNTFPGYEGIGSNYSQFFQDIFVLTALNGLNHGTYLELGAGHAYHNSNTALLTEWGWKGVSVDISEEFELDFKRNRPNDTFWKKDALEIDYSFLDPVVDYLQVDIDTINTDNGKLSLQVLEKIPFDTTEFKVITFEHDHYQDMTNSVRESSREFLKSKGYMLCVPNVSFEGVNSIEDWWVHPKYIKPEVLKTIKVISEDQITNVAEYFLKEVPYKYIRHPWDV